MGFPCFSAIARSVMISAMATAAFRLTLKDLFQCYSS